MKHLAINLNDHVLVKIMPAGVELMEKQHKALLGDRLTEIYPFKPPEVDSGGFTRMQLWVLMNHFGPYLNTGVVDIVGTQILIVQGD